MSIQYLNWKPLQLKLIELGCVYCLDNTCQTIIIVWLFKVNKPTNRRSRSESLVSQWQRIPLLRVNRQQATKRNSRRPRISSFRVAKWLPWLRPVSLLFPLLPLPRPTTERLTYPNVCAIIIVFLALKDCYLQNMLEDISWTRTLAFLALI